jgi:hypothetical protein
MRRVIFAAGAVMVVALIAGVSYWLGTANQREAEQAEGARIAEEHEEAGPEGGGAEGQRRIGADRVRVGGALRGSERLRDNAFRFARA